MKLINNIDVKDLPALMDKAMEKTGINLAEIGRRTGLNKESVYKWYRGTKPSDSMSFSKLVAFLTDHIETCGSSTPEELANHFALMDRHGHDFVTQRHLTYFLKVPLVSDGEPMPLLIPKGRPGTIYLEQDLPYLITYRIDAPFLSDISGAVDVTDNSMEPTLANGSHVGLTKLKDSTSVEWGRCYFIVDNNFQALIRRLYPCKDEKIVELAADNANGLFPAITREYSKIQALFRVKAYMNNM